MRAVAPIRSSVYARFEARREDRAHLTLRGGVIGDARVVPGLRRQHESTRLRRPAEKFRSRATGASNTPLLAELQRGGLRFVAAAHQRIQSAGSSGGVGDGADTTLLNGASDPRESAKSACKLAMVLLISKQ